MARQQVKVQFRKNDYSSKKDDHKYHLHMIIFGFQEFFNFNDLSVQEACLDCCKNAAEEICDIRSHGFKYIDTIINFSNHTFDIEFSPMDISDIRHCSKEMFEWFQQFFYKQLAEHLTEACQEEYELEIKADSDFKIDEMQKNSQLYSITDI